MAEFRVPSGAYKAMTVGLRVHTSKQHALGPNRPANGVRMAARAAGSVRNRQRRGQEWAVSAGKERVPGRRTAVDTRAVTACNSSSVTDAHS